MIVFQILLISLLILELITGIAIKYNWNGIQDKLMFLIINTDIEDYVRNRFPDAWIFQIIFLLVLIILSIC